MKKLLTILGLSILFLILDNTLVAFIAIKGFYPSILFTFAICYSIIQGKNESIRIGILSGILQDIYFFNGFGINCFANLITCFIAAEIGKNIFKDKKLIPVMSVLVLSILKSSLIYILFIVFKISMNPYKIVFISLYNMFIGIVLYPYIYKLCSKGYMINQWRF